MIAVQTPAATRGLLTIEELRAAAGITDDASDVALADLGDRVSDAIARHCNVADDGINPPSLLAETIVETFRSDMLRKRVILARRFVQSVTTVIENGTTLASTLYEMDRAAGLLGRLSTTDHPVAWPWGKIVVTYVAGFATPPDDLKHAAMLIVRQEWASASRDPLLKREIVDGVGEFDYWVGSAAEGTSEAFPAAALRLLAPYRTVPV